MARKKLPLQPIKEIGDIKPYQQSAEVNRQQYATLLKRANDRIKKMQAKGMLKGQGYAYSTYVESKKGHPFLKEKDGRLVFIQPKKPRKSGTKEQWKEYRKELQHALSTVYDFLSAKSSSIRGIEAIREKKREALLEHIKHLVEQDRIDFDSSTLTDEELDSILEFLGSKSGEQSKQTDDSNQVRNIIAYAVINNKKEVEEGKPYKTVTELFAEHQKKNESFLGWEIDLFNKLFKK